MRSEVYPRLRCALKVVVAAGGAAYSCRDEELLEMEEALATPAGSRRSFGGGLGSARGSSGSGCSSGRESSAVDEGIRFPLLRMHRASTGDGALSRGTQTTTPAAAGGATGLPRISRQTSTGGGGGQQCGGAHGARLPLPN